MVAALVVLALSACADDGPPETATAEPTTAGAEPTQEAPSPVPSPDSDPDLRAAVQAYSDGFLAGEPTQAYELFSARCKERVSLSYFTGLVAAAKATYGSALPIDSYEAQVAGDLARVTYTYDDVPALDQTGEPWVREDGAWRQDDC